MTNWIQIKIDDDGAEKVPFAPLSADEELTLLIPCTQPEHMDETPVCVLRLTKELALDLLVRFDAIAALPGETPAYVSYWDYTADFIELHAATMEDETTQENADFLCDQLIDMLWDGNIIVLTAEQVKSLRLDDTIRSDCEKLEMSPVDRSAGYGREDFWWSCGVKHTDFTLDTHAILADDLREFLGEK